MNEKELNQTNLPGDTEPQIVVNEYGMAKDAAVVVEEADRTVLLTDNETIVIDKEPHYDITPKNRPRKVYGGMWGQTEIATVGLAVLALLAVFLLYLFLVVPSNSDLQEQRVERNRLETELISARAKYGDITTTESQVAKLVASVDEFESSYLPISATGKTALYQRLNGLIAAYGLVNTTGPDYAPLETPEQDRSDQTDLERGRNKFQSLFPGVYVTTTLEGSYQNLRRFIREIETGNDFVIISAIELEPSDSERPADQSDPGAPAEDPTDLASVDVQTGQLRQVGSAPQQQYSRPRGKTHGQTVSLRLEMAAYFRRSVPAPLGNGVEAQ
jgi:uncharacterized membrane protein